VGWIDVLDKVPDIELLDHLAAFLDGLFNVRCEYYAQLSIDIIVLIYHY